jgi:DNA replication protein DnaC
MSWEDFCNINSQDIAPRYRNATKDNLTIGDNETGSFREKIEKLTQSPKSLILSGKAGRGKTYFLFAYLRALFEARKANLGNVRFYRSVDLDIKMVEEQQKHNRVDHFIKDLSQVKFLFLDDFGMCRDTSKAERDYYDLIDRRTAFEKITVFSTNFDEKGLKNIFGERISSRLKEFALIEFNGPDLRGVTVI